MYFILSQSIVWEVFENYDFLYGECLEAGIAEFVKDVVSSC